MKEQQSDHFTPGELGLLAGAEWVRLTLASGDDPQEAKVLEQIAGSAIIPASIREAVADHNIDERLADFGYPGAVDDFWRGFLHGVRSALAEAQWRREHQQ